MNGTKDRSPTAPGSSAAHEVSRRAWPSRVLLLGIVGGAALAVQAGLGLVSDAMTRRDATTLAMDDVVRGLLGAVLVVLGAWVGGGCIASTAVAVIARLRGSVRVPRVLGIPAFLRDLSGRAVRVGAVVVLAAGPSTAGAFEDPTALVPPTMVVVGAPPPAMGSSIAATVPPSRAAPTSPASERSSTSAAAPTTTGTTPGTTSTLAPRSAVSGPTPPSPTAGPPVPVAISPGPSASNAATARAASDAPRSHVVRTGEHFWSIAEDAVRSALGQEPSEAQTRRYWQRLIRANRTRLADPGDEDLIVPGQVLELPPVG